MHKTTMYKTVIVLNGLPKRINEFSGRKWFIKHGENKKWQKKLLVALGKNIPENPLQKASLILTRVSSSEPDFDGLVISFKSIIDSLVRLKVLQNDSPDHIGCPVYRWTRGKRNKGRIIIEIEEKE